MSYYKFKIEFCYVVEKITLRFAKKGLLLEQVT